jgi:multidrug efflux pump subunit AcrB
VRLDQVATVADTVAEQRSLATAQRQAGGGLRDHPQPGASEVEVGAGVSRALAELKAQHPDMELTQAFNFVTRWKRSTTAR